MHDQPCIIILFGGSPRGGAAFRGRELLFGEANAWTALIIALFSWGSEEN